LEEEFRGKLNALMTPEYRLTFRQAMSGPEIPSLLVDKILQDTLRTWAQYVSESKGALLYDIPVLSRSVLRWEEIARKDYWIALDILRINVTRMLDSLDLFRKRLPGADAVRVGQNRVSLEEIKTSLENLQRFTINPLSSTAIARVSQDPPSLRLYIESQFQQARLKRDEANRRVAGLERSLQYSEAQIETPTSLTHGSPGAVAQKGQSGETLRTEVSDAFLDRLIQMSGRKEEVSYRQRLVDQLISERFQAAKLEHEATYYETQRHVVGAAHLSGTGRVQELESRLKTAFDELAAATDNVVALHDQLAKKNLNPSTALYTLTLPYTQERIVPFTLWQAVLWGMAALIVTSFVLVLSALIYDHYHPAGWPAPQRQPLRST
jgi:hypothetical protein